MDNDVKTQNSESVAQSSINPEIEQARTLAELKNKVTVLENENKNLQEAKSKYYDQILNGGSADPIVEQKHRPIKEIRDDMIKGFENDITNLDYCKLAVELDDAIREDANDRGKVDSAFLPKGKDVQITVDEYNTADKMNKVLKECIEEADGNPDKFNMALEAHMPRR